MFDTIYTWLETFFFAGSSLDPTIIQFANTLLTCFVLAFVFYICTLPFKWVLSLISRG